MPFCPPPLLLPMEVTHPPHPVSLQALPWHRPREGQCSSRESRVQVASSAPYTNRRPLDCSSRGRRRASSWEIRRPGRPPWTCSRVVGAALWPFALLGITANILLAFPNWDTQYVHDWGKHLTPEVLYLGGLMGGGVMVLVPAVHIQATGRRGCCGNRSGMFLSVLFAAVGVVGAVYALGVSMLGLVHGPLCRYRLENGTLSDWGRPFRTDHQDFSKESYLFDTKLWETCLDPPGVIQFNVILFSLILGAGVVELALCFIQVFNGLFGCLCGTCNKEEETAPQTYN